MCVSLDAHVRLSSKILLNYDWLAVTFVLETISTMGIIVTMESPAPSLVNYKAFIDASFWLFWLLFQSVEPFDANNLSYYDGELTIIII